jgi:mannosyltransferase OCH1-like enzyme
MLHQVWFDLAGNAQPPPHAEHSECLRTLHPELPYRLWNQTDANDLVAKHYPQYINMWQQLPKGINRCDVFRYIVLHKFGGAYLDLDFWCVRSLMPLLLDNVVLVGEEWPRSMHTGSLHNGNLYSKTPGHPFWIELLDEIQRRLSVLLALPPPGTKDIQSCVFKLTGTAVLRDVVLAFWQSKKLGFGQPQTHKVIVLPYFILSPLAADDGSLMLDYTHPACRDTRRWRLIPPADIPKLSSSSHVFTVLTPSPKTWQHEF